MKNSKYPKILYVRQICNVDGKTKNFTELVKNKKAEETFRAQAASMEPNYTNEVSEIPINKPCIKNECKGNMKLGFDRLKGFSFYTCEKCFSTTM